MYIIYIVWVKNHNKRRHLVTSTNVFSSWSCEKLVSDSESTDWTNRTNYRTNWTSNWTTGWTNRPTWTMNCRRTITDRLIELNHSNERQTESRNCWQTANDWTTWIIFYSITDDQQLHELTNWTNQIELIEQVIKPTDHK